MKFAVKAWSKGRARAGVLQFVSSSKSSSPCPTEIEIETPALLLSTRKGLPFFISPDLLPSLPSPDSHLLQFSPLHFLEGITPETITTIGGLHEMLGLHEFRFAAVPRDSIVCLPHCEGTNKLGASFETPFGRILIKPSEYMKFIDSMKPNSWTTLADEVPAWVSQKRNKTSVDRTVRWLDDCIALSSKGGNIFGAIVGGSSVEERRRSAQEAAKRNVSGYWIGGFGLGESMDDRPPLLNAVTDSLPEQKPRQICGLGLPEEVLQGIDSGVDLFDTTYIYHLTTSPLCRNPFRCRSFDFPHLNPKTPSPPLQIASILLKPIHLLQRPTGRFRSVAVLRLSRTNPLQQNEHVAKFRDRSLEHEELMHRVFKEVTATGDYVYILSEHDTDQANPFNMEEEDRLEAEEFAEGGGNTVGVDLGVEPGHTIGVDLGDDVSTEVRTQSHEAFTPPNPRSKPRNQGQESSGSKRKTPSSGTDELSQSMDRILRNQNNRNLKLVVRMKHAPADVSQMLATMDCFNVRPRPPLYWWATEYLQANPIAADWMMGQSGEEDRLEYLQHLHTKASEMASTHPDECRPPPPWTLT